MTFRLPHLIAALLLHALLLSLLVGGVQCSAKPHRPPVISAVLLDPSRQETVQQKRREEQRRQEQRKAEQARKRREEEQQKARELEQQRQAKTDAARKKKEEDAKRTKQAAEQKKAEGLARRKKEQDEKREQDAATRRDKEEQTRMQQAMQEEAMRRDLDREHAARAASERDAKLAHWADQLVRHVQGNYTTPPGAPPDFDCQVRMQLLPDGTVTNAKIVKSCGSAPLDRAVEDAVYRSSPMPGPADRSVFDRDLTINFTP